MGIYIGMRGLDASTGRQKGNLTVNNNITHGIGPIPLLLRPPIILPQQSGKVSRDGMTLRQDPTIEFDDGDFPHRVQLRDLRPLGLRPLFERVPHIFVRDAGIFPQKTNHLAASARLHVEIVNCGQAADGVVGGGGRADFLGGRHGGLFRLGTRFALVYRGIGVVSEFREWKKSVNIAKQTVYRCRADLQGKPRVPCQLWRIRGFDLESVRRWDVSSIPPKDLRI